MSREIKTFADLIALFRRCDVSAYLLFIDLLCCSY